MSENRPQSPIYIKVNPHLVYTTQPQQKLFESQLVPPNPKWWHELSIYNRSHEGCSFFWIRMLIPKKIIMNIWSTIAKIFGDWMSLQKEMEMEISL